MTGLGRLLTIRKQKFAHCQVAALNHLGTFGMILMGFYE
jgi:hypothetical protein